MKKIFNLLLILALAAGCSRYIDSSDVTQELPLQPPIPIGLKLTHLAEGVSLSWQVSDTAAARSFKIYTADSLNGRYVVRDSSQTFSKTITGLSAGRNHFFKVSTLVSGGLEGPLSEAVSTRPGTLSITINNDDKYTRLRSVTLAFVVPVAAILVQASEDPNFVDAHWEDFAPTLSRTLSDGDGVKRIFARFQFADGSNSAGSVSDSIILDTRAFIDSVYFALPPVPSPGSAMTFFLLAGETDGSAEVSFPGLTRLVLYDDGTNGDLLAGDRIYSRRYIIPVNLEVAGGIVTGKFRDAAGNNADDRTASALLNISRAPEPVTLTAVAESSSSIRLSWSQSAGSDFASYQIYRHINGSVSNNSYLVSIVTSRNTVAFTDDNLQANTPYFYRVYVYDNTGLFSPSNVAADTTPVNLAPLAVKLAVRAQDLSSILTWTANNDNDFASYQIYRDTVVGVTETTGRLLTIINSQTSTTFTDTRPDTLKYYYKVYVYDGQGLMTGSNEVAAP